MPANEMSRAAVAIILFLAAPALRNPSAFRHLDFLPVTAFGPRTDFPALGLPDLIMVVLRTCQGVGNFMQNGVTNILVAVHRNQVNAQFDSAGLGSSRIDADTGTANVLVESERPPGETVLSHEGDGESSRPLAFPAQSLLVHAVCPKKKVAR